MLKTPNVKFVLQRDDGKFYGFEYVNSNIVWCRSLDDEFIRKFKTEKDALNIADILDEVVQINVLVNNILEGAFEQLRDLYIPEYLKQLQNVNIRDDQAFHNLLNKGIILMQLLDTDISHTFGCSIPTVKRWKNGINSPHPSMRKPIYDWLIKSIIEN